VSLKIGKCRHYKDKEYEMIGVARHSETLEELVVYRALYDSEDFEKNSLWVRPKEMFLEKLQIDWRRVPRFELIEG
jgi:hypothetical protein